MAEQQYRVVADRDKGDNVDTVPWEEGDLLVYRIGPRSNVWLEDQRELVRIERMAPSSEQIAEVIGKSNPSVYIRLRDRAADSVGGCPRCARPDPERT